MRRNFAGTVLAALLVCLPVSAQVQKGARATATKAWTVPLTRDGHPDFEGFWTNSSITPLERPVALGAKEFYTEVEALAFERGRTERDNNQAKDDIHYDNVLWQSENYSRGGANRRTSVIFDPPEGRLPPLSAAGQKGAVRQAEEIGRAHV